MSGRIRTQMRPGSEVAGVEFTNGDQPGVRLTMAAAARVAESPTSTATSKVGRSKSAKATKPK
jgi:hypothetical protein